MVKKISEIKLNENYKKELESIKNDNLEPFDRIEKKIIAVLDRHVFLDQKNEWDDWAENETFIQEIDKLAEAGEHIEFDSWGILAGGNPEFVFFTYLESEDNSEFCIFSIELFSDGKKSIHRGQN